MPILRPIVCWLLGGVLCATGVPAAAQSPRNPLAQDAPTANPLAQNPLASAAARPAAAPMKFTRLAIHDPGINNIEAVSFLIPAGWKTEGGIQWFPDCSVLANLLLKIYDPQTGACIQFLPVQNFTWLTQMVVPMQPGTNYMGNILAQPIQDPAEFVQLFYAPTVLQHLRGARPVDGQDLPKIAALVAQQYGGQSQVRATRLRYQYDLHGQPWEEDIFLTLVYTHWQLGTLWSVTSAYSVRAPRGALDRMSPIANTVVNTARLNPDWYCGYMYVQQLFNNRMNQSIANARAISDTITRNSEQIRQMFADSYRQRQESQDRISQGFSEYIRGVETYRDPFENRPIQLPSGYNDAWVNAKGEYLLSNQAGFDPNVGDTTEWRRMDRRTDRP